MAVAAYALVCIPALCKISWGNSYQGCPENPAPLRLTLPYCAVLSECYSLCPLYQCDTLFVQLCLRTRRAFDRNIYARMNLLTVQKT